MILFSSVFVWLLHTLWIDIYLIYNATYIIHNMLFKKQQWEIIVLGQLTSHIEQAHNTWDPSRYTWNAMNTGYITSTNETSSKEWTSSKNFKKNKTCFLSLQGKNHWYFLHNVLVRLFQTHSYQCWRPWPFHGRVWKKLPSFMFSILSVLTIFALFGVKHGRTKGTGNCVYIFSPWNHLWLSSLNIEKNIA